MTSHRQEIVQQRIILAAKRAILPLPSQRQITRADDFNKVHVVEGRVIRRLLRQIQRVGMVIRPWHSFLRSKPLRHAFWHLRPKAQMMDAVRKGVRIPIWRVQIVVQVMYMHSSIAETPPWRDMKVPNDFVDAKSALDSAALATLSVKLFAVMFPLALFNVFATAKGPRYGGISFAHFFAGITAAGFDGCGGRDSAVAIAAVIGVKMGGRLFTVTRGL